MIYSTATVCRRLCWIFLISLTFLHHGAFEKQPETCPEMCQCNGTRILCEQEIPNSIPTTVTQVKIHGVDFAAYANDTPFNNTGWGGVTYLYINANELENGTKLYNHEPFTMQTKTFYHLRNLQHLTFINSDMQDMKYNVFAGLSRLETLNFNGNINLRISDFIKGLRGYNLSHLTELHLCNISKGRGVANVFGSGFFELLSTTKLKLLDLSDIEGATMDTPSFSTQLPHLQEVVFERAGYLGINIFRANFDYSDAPVYKNLRKVNINYPTIPSAIFEAAELLETNKYIGYDTVPNNFTSVRARACVPNSMPSYLFSANYTSCLGVVMSFPLIQVNWTIFCLPYHSDGGLYLEVLDTSENGIEYLHPTLTASATRLLYLDVSANRLFQMNEADLESMVHYCPDLKTLILSNNSLASIPFRMFERSHSLEALDLSHNKLKYVDFNVNFLTKLQKFDLSYNEIVSLDGSTRVQLDNLILRFQSQVAETDFQMPLHHNPLECSCNTIEFEKWVISTKKKCDLGDVRCYHKTSVVPINEDVYKESEFECKLITIYAVVGSIGALIFVIILVFAVRYIIQFYRRSKQQRLEKMISRYKASCNDSGSYKVPVFLSHSGSDGDFVLEKILPQLDSTLKSLLRTSNRCVTTGDFSFRPGQYVADEIIRCVEESRVIVACVSQQFCKSHWCKNEIIVSQMENKPLVLILLEHVKTAYMPKCLRKHFDKTTRCKVSKNDNGEVILHPNIETICESIMQLMAKSSSSKSDV